MAPVLLGAIILNYLPTEKSDEPYCLTGLYLIIITFPIAHNTCRVKKKALTVQKVLVFTG